MWNPLGVTGARDSAFNFPGRGMGLNDALALVAATRCGVERKTSEETPLTALAVKAIFARCSRAEFESESGTPEGGLLQVMPGGRGGRGAGRSSA